MEYNNEYNMDLYPRQLHWQEGDLTATRTTMWSGPGCHEGCQIIFYTDKDGKLVKTEGRFPRAACACAAWSCRSWSTPTAA